MATTKKQPAKKSPVKKLAVKKSAPKKSMKKQDENKLYKVSLSESKKTPSLEQQLKEKSAAYLELSGAYTELIREHLGLKRSFSMVKENYEREKNRLDKVIAASLNNSKALEAITNTDDAFSSPEPSDSCGAALCCKQ